MGKARQKKLQRQLRARLQMRTTFVRKMARGLVLVHLSGLRRMRLIGRSGRVYVLRQPLFQAPHLVRID
jgi:hypothetical protein